MANFSSGFARGWGMGQDIKDRRRQRTEDEYRRERNTALDARNVVADRQRAERHGQTMEANALNLSNAQKATGAADEAARQQGLVEQFTTPGALDSYRQGISETNQEAPEEPKMPSASTYQAEAANIEKAIIEKSGMPGPGGPPHSPDGNPQPSMLGWKSRWDLDYNTLRHAGMNNARAKEVVQNRIQQVQDQATRDMANAVRHFEAGDFTKAGLFLRKGMILGGVPRATTYSKNGQMFLKTPSAAEGGSGKDVPITSDKMHYFLKQTGNIAESHKSRLEWADKGAKTEGTKRKTEQVGKRTHANTLAELRLIQDTYANLTGEEKEPSNPNYINPASEGIATRIFMNQRAKGRDAKQLSVKADIAPAATAVHDLSVLNIDELMENPHITSGRIRVQKDPKSGEVAVVYDTGYGNPLYLSPDNNLAVDKLIKNVATMIQKQKEKADDLAAGSGGIETTSPLFAPDVLLRQDNPDA